MVHGDGAAEGLDAVILVVVDLKVGDGGSGADALEGQPVELVGGGHVVPGELDADTPEDPGIVHVVGAAVEARITLALGLGPGIGGGLAVDDETAPILHGPLTPGLVGCEDDDLVGRWGPVLAVGGVSHQAGAPAHHQIGAPDTLGNIGLAQYRGPGLDGQGGSDAAVLGAVGTAVPAHEDGLAQDVGLVAGPGGVGEDVRRDLNHRLGLGLGSGRSSGGIGGSTLVGGRDLGKVGFGRSQIGEGGLGDGQVVLGPIRLAVGRENDLVAVGPGHSAPAYGDGLSGHTETDRCRGGWRIRDHGSGWTVVVISTGCEAQGPDAEEPEKGHVAHPLHCFFLVSFPHVRGGLHRFFFDEVRIPRRIRLKRSAPGNRTAARG